MCRTACMLMAFGYLMKGNSLKKWLFEDRPMHSSKISIIFSPQINLFHLRGSTMSFTHTNAAFSLTKKQFCSCTLTTIGWSKSLFLIVRSTTVISQSLVIPNTHLFYCHAFSLICSLPENSFSSYKQGYTLSRHQWGNPKPSPPHFR